MELSIFYNGQFFVALVEYKMVNNSKFIQYTFGNEPDDLEVLDFIHHQLMKSIDDVQTIVCTKNISRKVNPKRLQRQIAKEQKKPKYSTQAQIAIKKELELKKKQKRKRCKEKRDAFQKRKREIKKVKAKEKHKGH
ncbi:YjdF family protein [Staphylococcus aureus]|nr:YjdF family protein [Staphylococcus aureus]